MSGSPWFLPRMTSLSKSLNNVSSTLKRPRKTVNGGGGGGGLSAYLSC